jgi:hypothetical protein
LHPAASLAVEMKQGATTIGAAVPIRYAIALLRKQDGVVPQDRGPGVAELH